MSYVPFTYSFGPSGFVPAEALATFQRKDAGVEEATRLRGQPHSAAAEAAIKKVINANRRIKSKGWHFYTSLPNN